MSDPISLPLQNLAISNAICKCCLEISETNTCSGCIFFRVFRRYCSFKVLSDGADLAKLADVAKLAIVEIESYDVVKSSYVSVAKLYDGADVAKSSSVQVDQKEVLAMVALLGLQFAPTELVPNFDNITFSELEDDEVGEGVDYVNAKENLEEEPDTEYVGPTAVVAG
ncbi:hypothetical protein K7X08_029959 [Anisodus acutangulus]|uniref:Uncharacterized protein n=1 Tax=Anisodus acutangulus TaxID=402998 RepID=A0A9Q1LNN1_9SOLA|nr:hypothetical protein K7X08_029959 [Anisodus acutangulus]